MLAGRHFGKTINTLNTLVGKVSLLKTLSFQFGRPYSEYSKAGKRAVFSNTIVNRGNVNFVALRTFETGKRLLSTKIKSVENIRDKMPSEQERKTLESVERSLNNWLKPPVLGEGWDNVGLLIGSGKFEKDEKVITGIMLCNDLRPSVLEEAISRKVDMVIAYHPLIFSGMKSISYGNWKERLVAKCIANDISVYCPHTTLDSTVGGINDRVLNALRSGPNEASPIRAITPLRTVDSDIRGTTFTSDIDNITKLLHSVPFQDFSDVLFSVMTDNSSATLSVYGKSSLDTVVKIILDIELPDLRQGEADPTPPFGGGRMVDLAESVELDDAVDAIKSHLGLGWVTLAYGGNPKVKSAAVCVGSGSSLLKPIAGKVDLLITGEMSHHDILECVSAKSSVVLCTHCSSERHYLPDLANILKVVTGVSNVFVSEEDCSPLRLVL